MNQLCRVCGEPAAGFHFGAFTCEGCKSFFGRTYNNLSSISECKNNGECIINKKNRTSCKACRLRKCLMVGMSKSGSRYGRRSNWFKIHCLLSESHQTQQLKCDEDNNNVKTSPSKEPSSRLHTDHGPPLWQLHTRAAAAALPPLFGFPPHPLHPFYLTRPPPTSIGPPQPPPLPLPVLAQSSLPPALSTSALLHHHQSTNRQRTITTPQPVPPSQPPVPNLPPAVSVAPSATIQLELLRNLGPVQDTPMDLSVRMQSNRKYSIQNIGTPVSSPSSASSNNNNTSRLIDVSDDDDETNDDVHGDHDDVDDVASSCSDLEMSRHANFHQQQQREIPEKKTPLDLTCVKI